MNGAFIFAALLIAVLTLASAWRSAGHARDALDAERRERMAHRRTKIILRMEEDRADAYLNETLRLREQIDNPQKVYWGVDLGAGPDDDVVVRIPITGLLKRSDRNG